MITETLKCPTCGKKLVLLPDGNYKFLCAHKFDIDGIQQNKELIIPV